MLYKNNRLEEEKQTIEQMIRLYCLRKEKNKYLCTNCQELLEYAHTRLNRCRFGDKKTTCKKCLVHCYHPERKKEMQRIMRYVGPRMLFYHPLAAIRHLYRELFFM